MVQASVRKKNDRPVWVPITVATEGYPLLQYVVTAQDANGYVGQFWLSNPLRQFLFLSEVMLSASGGRADYVLGLEANMEQKIAPKEENEGSVNSTPYFMTVYREKSMTLLIYDTIDHSHSYDIVYYAPRTTTTKSTPVFIQSMGNSLLEENFFPAAQMHAVLRDYLTTGIKRQGLHWERNILNTITKSP
jgi:hypothetical protein